jgi:hypothetical protein
MNFWLFRSGPSLRFCAAIPKDQNGVRKDSAPVTVYASPGSFLSRLDTTVFGPAKVSEIKTAVIRQSVRWIMYSRSMTLN